MAGERLDAATFHERHAAMPESTRADLIGGVGHIPSPLRDDHGFEGVNVVGWLRFYAARTPGVVGVRNTSTRLDARRETQPDYSLLVPPESGGQTWVEGRLPCGAPELVVEVAKSSRSIDFGTKKDDYERTGVREYIVVAIDPDDVYWFALRGARFERLAPGEDGLYRSEDFPGLWLDPKALLDEDLPRLIAVVDLGVAKPEHAAFAARLGRR